MRKKVTKQLGIVIRGSEHRRLRELAKMSEILDQLPEALSLVQRDLVRNASPKIGREAMTAEQVLRALAVKQLFNASYDDLALQVGDWNSVRAFCRLSLGDTPPSRSTLQRNIALLRPRTLEKINQLIVAYALAHNVETGERTRSDCTVVETHIHDPSDSSLLRDIVRVLVRLLGHARSVCDVTFSDRNRRAKRRHLGILNAKSEEQRRPLYRDLLQITEEMMAHAARIIGELKKVRSLSKRTAAGAIEQAICDVLEQAKHVVDQTQRRVLCGESVPSNEKVVSIFEPHTDIIVKDRRETLYGHKVCITTGASGLVVDLVVESGNPADSTLAVKMVRRAAAILGDVPRQVAFDGGFTSKANVEEIKSVGVCDVAFSKHKGIEITDMASSERVFRGLRNFRAGIEATISNLKRSFGFDRCDWHGFDGFVAYTWSSVLAANLLLLSRHLL